MLYKYQIFSEDILSHVQEEISSVREENHTQKKIFTSYRRRYSSVTTSSAAGDSFFGCT
jgi:hypothetical protein